MSVSVTTLPLRGLTRIGLHNIETLHYQLSPEELIMDTLRLGQGVLNDTGALVIKTGEFTGRSPKDKFIVKDEITADTVHWNDFNLPIEQKYFDIIHKKICILKTCPSSGSVIAMHAPIRATASISA